jgi:polar amino acid transport system permease protein
MTAVHDLVDLVVDNHVLFLRGIGMTLTLLIYSSAIGFALALPLALARVSRARCVAAGAYAYTYLFRGTPLLTQLFLIYYGLAQFGWVRASPLWPILRDPWPCALIALSLNMSAYVAEILRGGIQGVPAGEREAAVAMGMSPALLYRRIILPRALGIALPALGNEVVVQMKSTALISTITLLDVTGVARRIAARTYSTDALLIAGLIYVIMTYIITQGFRFAERRANRGFLR